MKHFNIEVAISLARVADYLVHANQNYIKMTLYTMVDILEFFSQFFPWTLHIKFNLFLLPDPSSDFPAKGEYSHLSTPNKIFTPIDLKSRNF